MKKLFEPLVNGVLFTMGMFTGIIIWFEIIDILERSPELTQKLKRKTRGKIKRLQRKVTNNGQSR